jgi:hypothetical protein
MATERSKRAGRKSMEGRKRKGRKATERRKGCLYIRTVAWGSAPGPTCRVPIVRVRWAGAVVLDRQRSAAAAIPGSLGSARPAAVPTAVMQGASRGRGIPARTGLGRASGRAIGAGPVLRAASRVTAGGLPPHTNGQWADSIWEFAPWDILGYPGIW